MQLYSKYKGHAHLTVKVLILSLYLQDFASLYEVIKAKHPPFNAKRVHEVVIIYQKGFLHLAT